MATTPTYALPYPAESDTVDVPRDIQALATFLDSLLSNGTSGGPLTLSQLLTLLGNLTLKRDDTAAVPTALVLEGATVTALQLLLGLNTSGSPFGSIQAVHQTVGDLPLKLNPDGGQVQVGPGGLQSAGPLDTVQGAFISAFDSTAGKYIALNHNSTQGIVSANVGDIEVFPATGRTHVVGALWEDGLIAISSNHTVGINEKFVRCDGGIGAFTVTLPTAVGCTGATVDLQKIDGTTNRITLATTGGQTINGIASGNYQLVSENHRIVVRSNGSYWDLVTTSGGSLQATCTGDVAMSVGTTWYDATGCSLTLPAGKWDLSARCLVTSGASASTDDITAIIRDSANTIIYASAESGATSGNGGDEATMSMRTIQVFTAGATTLKISAVDDQAGAHGATIRQNSLNSTRYGGMVTLPAGGVATQLTAVQLA